MPDLNIPPPLRTGDRIVVLSPSSPLAAWFPERLARGVGFLESLGYEVSCLPSTRADDGNGTAASAESVADELHASVADDRTRLVLSAIGGDTAIRVLPHLDLGHLAQHPTWICGYSDATAILLASLAAGSMSLYGPQLLPQIAEVGGPHPYTLAALLSAASWDGAERAISPSGLRIDDRPDWADTNATPRRASRGDGPRTIVEGEATGSLLVANLNSLVRLGGTRFQPLLAGRIVVFEVSEGCSIPQLVAMLSQVSQWGGWSDIAALGFGRFPPGGITDGEELAKILAGPMNGIEGPVIAGLDVGHTDPMTTLPIGALARVSAFRDREPTLSVAAKAVEGYRA